MWMGELPSLLGPRQLRLLPFNATAHSQPTNQRLPVCRQLVVSLSQSRALRHSLAACKPRLCDNISAYRLRCTTCA